MKPLGTTSFVIIYSISIFGAIDILTDGIKPIPNTILLIYILLAFGVQLLNKNRLLVSDIMVLAFALLSSLGFALFISDLIYQPIAIAEDCEGHLPSRKHYFDIMLIGLVVFAVFGYIFLKTHKIKGLPDKVLSFIVILTAILCYSEVSIFKTLNQYIDKVSIPVNVLPKGC